MRLIILTLLILIGYSAIAQKDSSESSSLDIYYGSRSYFQNFYNQLNTIKKTEFNKPVQTIGVGYSGHFSVIRSNNFYGHFIYSQVIPQTIYIGNQKGKITGFVFSVAYGAAITPSKIFCMFLYIGFNTGRLRMYDNELLRQKNPFFSPKIGIQPKIKIGKKIFLSLVIECEYDISSSKWKRTIFSNNNKININNFRQTGVTAQLALGYAF